MKTEEDEAFEDIERRQGGFQAKRAMAADKLQEPVALDVTIEGDAVKLLADMLQPVREQWLQGVIIKIETALLSHRLSLHNDADDDGVGFPLVDALCCGQTTIEFGKREVEDIVEAIYHVLDANTPPAPAAQPVQEPDLT
jgi:hypothetical protein